MSVSAVSGTGAEVVVAQKSFLYKILVPRPNLAPADSLTTHIKRKDTRKRAETGAARISNEKRFVKGLGYVRADATRCRPKAVKRGSSTSTESNTPVEDLERVCVALMTHNVQSEEQQPAERPSGPQQGLYEFPRFPSTFD
ncbi:hypothetical protein FRC12_006520 [Ceratobasidium sp. 428]|nr:hypothetical protein FRC12_006520 [Ceratobasidium sp. 428]